MDVILARESDDPGLNSLPANLFNIKKSVLYHVSCILSEVSNLILRYRCRHNPSERYDRRPRDYRMEWSPISGELHF